MQRREVLSTHEVKYTGRWGSSIAPSGRSSFMKYLNKISNGNILYYCHPVDLKARIKSQLGIEFIPIDGSLDGKACLPLVLKLGEVTYCIHSKLRVRLCFSYPLYTF
jgi:hypothetical protein